MERYLIGLDYGTGGAKATIINTNGRELAYAFEEYPILTPHPGWSEHDPHIYWQASFYGVAFDLLKKDFNQEILDKIGIDRDLFPELYKCEDVIG